APSDASVTPSPAPAPSMLPETACTPSGYRHRKYGKLASSSIAQTSSKSQPTSVNVPAFISSAVVLPVPPAEAPWPVVCVFQKLSLTSESLKPTSPPTLLSPVTAPMAYALLIVPLLVPTRPPTFWPSPWTAPVA